MMFIETNPHPSQRKINPIAYFVHYPFLFVSYDESLAARSYYRMKPQVEALAHSYRTNQSYFPSTAPLILPHRC